MISPGVQVSGWSSRTSSTRLDAELLAVGAAGFEDAVAEEDQRAGRVDARRRRGDVGPVGHHAQRRQGRLEEHDRLATSRPQESGAVAGGRPVQFTARRKEAEEGGDELAPFQVLDHACVDAAQDAVGVGLHVGQAPARSCGACDDDQRRREPVAAGVREEQSKSPVGEFPEVEAIAAGGARRRGPPAGVVAGEDRRALGDQRLLRPPRQVHLVAQGDDLQRGLLEVVALDRDAGLLGQELDQCDVVATERNGVLVDCLYDAERLAVEVLERRASRLRVTKPLRRSGSALKRGSR